MACKEKSQVQEESQQKSLEEPQQTVSKES
jgi:hypothetical protein